MPQFRNVYGALGGADALLGILSQRKEDELKAIADEERKRQLLFENEQTLQDYGLRARTVGVAERRLALDERTQQPEQDLIWVNDPDNPGQQKLVRKAEGLVNPPAPRKPEALTDLGEAFVDYAFEKYGDRNHPLTFADKEAAKKRWEATNDRPTDPAIHELRALNIAALQRTMSGEMTPAQFSMAARLRDDFRVESTDFNTQEFQYRKIKNFSRSEPSAAGDLSLVFAYMKMLDPPSVVREGEQATAQNARGVPDAIKNLYNRVMTGERLTPAQRADFITRAGNLYQASLPAQQRRVASYRGQAADMNLPDKFVVTDPDPDLSAPESNVSGFIVRPKAGRGGRSTAPSVDVGGYQVRPKVR